MTSSGTVKYTSAADTVFTEHAKANVTSFQVMGHNPDGTFDIRWLDGSISSARKVVM
ncbi:hypothetical protein [Lacrimispora sp. 38-1]|uniref:hypothetical protein n=1 Tax=Lacrimispora sp. 38-1 TaxID=3125778 RepID=UPI003CFA6282